MITSNVHCHHPSTGDMTGPRTFVDSQCHINLGPVRLGSVWGLSLAPSGDSSSTLSLENWFRPGHRVASAVSADWRRPFKDYCLDCNQSKFVNYPTLL